MLMTCTSPCAISAGTAKAFRRVANVMYTPCAPASHLEPLDRSGGQPCITGHIDVMSKHQCHFDTLCLANVLLLMHYLVTGYRFTAEQVDFKIFKLSSDAKWVRSYDTGFEDCSMCCCTYHHMSLLAFKLAQLTYASTNLWHAPPTCLSTAIATASEL